MDGSISLTIVHSLPGRLRLRISHPPPDWVTMKKRLSNHAGLNSLVFNPATNSLLLYYDSSEITKEEFIIRVAVLLSSFFNLQPVLVLAYPKKENLTPSTYISGSLIIISILSRIMPSLRTMQKTFDVLSGLGTVGAVFEHGYREIRETGTFHPELFSVVYLLSSLLRGTGFTASIITWLASFGRHLTGPSMEGLELRAVKYSGDDPKNPSFEVTIKKASRPLKNGSFLNFIPSLLADVVSGGSIGQERLLDQIKEVSMAHNSVLEGLGAMKSGISVRID